MLSFVVAIVFLWVSAVYTFKTFGCQIIALVFCPTEATQRAALSPAASERQPAELINSPPGRGNNERLDASTLRKEEGEEGWRREVWPRRNDKLRGQVEKLHGLFAVCGEIDKTPGETSAGLESDCEKYENENQEDGKFQPFYSFAPPNVDTIENQEETDRLGRHNSTSDCTETQTQFRNLFSSDNDNKNELVADKSNIRKVDELDMIIAKKIEKSPDIRKRGSKLPRHLQKLQSSVLKYSLRFAKSSPSSPTSTPPLLPSPPTLPKHCALERDRVTRVMPVKSPLESVILKRRLGFANRRAKSTDESTLVFMSTETEAISKDMENDIHTETTAEIGESNDYGNDVPAAKCEDHVKNYTSIASEMNTNSVPKQSLSLMPDNYKASIESEETVVPFEEEIDTPNHTEGGQVLDGSGSLSSISSTATISNETFNQSTNPIDTVCNPPSPRPFINTKSNMSASEYLQTSNNSDQSKFSITNQNKSLCNLPSSSESLEKHTLNVRKGSDIDILRSVLRNSMPELNACHKRRERPNTLSFIQLAASSDLSSSVTSINKLILTATGTPVTPPEERKQPEIRILSPEMISLSTSADSVSSSDSNYSYSASSSSDAETQRESFYEPENQSGDNLKLHDTSLEKFWVPLTSLNATSSADALNRTVYDVTNSYVNLHFPQSMKHLSSGLNEGTTSNEPNTKDNLSYDLQSLSYKPPNYQNFRYIDTSSCTSLISDQSSRRPESFIVLPSSSDNESSSGADILERSSSALATPFSGPNDSTKSLEDLAIYMTRYRNPNGKQTNSRRDEERETNATSDNLEKYGPPASFAVISTRKHSAKEGYPGNYSSMNFEGGMTGREDTPINHFLPAKEVEAKNDLLEAAGLIAPQTPDLHEKSGNVHNRSSDIKSAMIISQQSCMDSNSSVKTLPGNEKQTIREDHPAHRSSKITKKRKRLISRLRDQDLEALLQQYFFDDPLTSLSPLCSSPTSSSPSSPLLQRRQYQVKTTHLKAIAFGFPVFRPLSANF